LSSNNSDDESSKVEGQSADMNRYHTIRIQQALEAFQALLASVSEQE
jgi:hypothetical protein